MFDMYAAEKKVPLSVVVVDVNGSSVSNGAEKTADFGPGVNFGHGHCVVVPADNPLVMGTQNCQNTIQPNDAQADHQTDTQNCPVSPPIAESVTSEVGSTREPNVAHADQQQPQNRSAVPFDNKEEYVLVDDEHLVGLSIPEPLIVQPPAPIPDEESEDGMDDSDVKHLIQQRKRMRLLTCLFSTM